MGKKKESKSGLGRAIQNAGNQPRTRKQLQERHTIEMGIDKGSSLASVIERNALDEFVATAMMEQREFAAERGTVSIIDDQSSGDKQPEQYHELYDYVTVPIPRRPAWDQSTTRDELERMEKLAFLDWRRDLAKVVESSKQAVTPYEKNLEVWKQLWRVIERSDLIVQIVDARNPLLFLCKDMEVAVHELNRSKRTLVVINKADYLSDHMRMCWASYFTAQNVEFVFFSAKDEVLRQEQERKANRIDSDEDAAEDDDDGMSCEDDEEIDDEENDDEDEEHDDDYVDGRAGSESAVNDDEPSILSVLNTRQLTDRFLKVYCGDDIPIADDDLKGITVGLVGYPNVGKSSIINALMGEKKVGVAAMPGKTRHFQTLILNDRITLCDCPGLVFPTFVNSQSDLVCNGILPIDRIRDYLPPSDLICKRVHKRQFQNLYGVRFPVDLTPAAHDLLTALARIRGLVTGRALPDEATAARIILKDFTAGRLLYCHPPPGSDTDLFLASLEMPLIPPSRQDRPDLPNPVQTDSILSSTLSMGNTNMAFTGSSKGVKKALKQARARVKAQLRGKTKPNASSKAVKGGKSRNVIAIADY